MSFLSRVLVLLFLTLAVQGSALAGPGSDGYRLGPQDKLEVRVHDLRTGTGEAHQWSAFDGEFLVSATGGVSLPLLGELQAGGGTTADLAEAVAQRIQAKVGLAQLPSASVQVIKYRPFYITGAVDKPGEYDFRPGLTVLQAVSIAGGLIRARDGALLGFEREALVQRGDLRTLTAERQGFEIRQARIAAEIAEAESVSYPDQTRKNGNGFDAPRAIREETQLFHARRGALQAQLQALDTAKGLLHRELASLDDKDAALSSQIDLLRRELASVSGLVSKGLAVVPRQFAVEQSVAAYETNRIDIQVTRLRAQQDLSRAEREALDLRAKRRDEALTEAGEVRTKLAAVIERIETATNLIYQAEVRSPMMLEENNVDLQPIYARTRRNGGDVGTRSVSESDAVEPGDVVRVSIPRRSTTAVGSARADAAPPAR